jgi:hypothetical protein
MKNTILKASAAIAGLTILFAGTAEATCSFNFSKLVIPKGHTVNLIVTCDNSEAFTSIDWKRDTTSASGGAGFPLAGDAQTGPFAYRTWDKLDVGTYSYTMTGVNATGGGTTVVGPVSLTITAPPVTTTTGSCGTSDGHLTHSAPASNLCIAGNASAITTTAGAYSWTCTGSDAGNTSCQAPRGYNITATATNGSLTPSGTILTAYRAAQTFTLSPNAGSAVVQSGAGQCGGIFSGASNTSYTTQPITADCAVTANFTTVSGASCGADSGGATLKTATPTALCSAGNPSAVATSAARYDWSCTGTGNPTPTATCYANRGYTVTASAGANGSISPTSVAVAYNSIGTFTLTPDTANGYIVDPQLTTSTCGGSLVGTTYTTNAITASCSVSAFFKPGVSPIDPGIGTLWVPPGHPNLLVADQMGVNGAGTINYLPGCIDHSPPPDASFKGCAANDSYTGIPAGTSSAYTFQFLQGNILSIRVTGKNDGFPSAGSFILTGASGNNVYSNVSLWITADPTVTYAATPDLCKNSSGQQPSVRTWASTCPLTAGARYYVNIMVNDALHCGESGSQCQFQLSESTDSQ